ncbi:MAG: hypothetical protein EPO28_01685 [Saprospiraceae bacterium]|nr:MAG: hypothetical protein EPO28_01685 [Saprospiraceae bacterium]
MSGILVPVELLKAASHNAFDYTGKVAKAVHKDEQAFQELLLFSNNVDSLTGKQHGQVLLSLLEKVGDVYFARVLANLDEDGQHATWKALDEGLPAGPDTLNKLAPLTWKTLLPQHPPAPFSGLYIFNEKTSTYLDCAAPGERYLAIDETGAINRNFKRMLRYPYPGQAIYAEVKGFKTDFFGAMTLPDNYTAFIILTEIVNLEVKNFRNTCIPYDLWALGNEPFWQAEISANEGVIEFQELGFDGSRFFPFVPSTMEDSTTIYASINHDTGDNIRISVFSEKCGDTMSDSVYQYKVALTMNGKRFTGCGRTFPVVAMRKKGE